MTRAAIFSVAYGGTAVTCQVSFTSKFNSRRSLSSRFFFALLRLLCYKLQILLRKGATKQPYLAVGRLLRFFLLVEKNGILDRRQSAFGR